VQLTCYRIPFFYEPNFDARVEPLAAALRIQADPSPHHAELANGRNGVKRYEPVVYGDFLLKKVGGNFAPSAGEKASRY
jgi:isopenicillin N synthase-like dioxygenase